VAAFPIQPEQLSSEWFTKTLHESGKLASTNEVSGFDVGFIGDGVGLLGMVLRVSLKYAHAEGAGPASVVIKFAHPVPENRAIAANLNMYEREVTFFNEIAPEVSTPKPVCYFAGMDYDNGSNIVVLEDLNQYRAGDQVKGISVDEAKMVIDALAPLHAKYWGKYEGKFKNMMQINTSYVEPFVPSVEGTWQPALANFGYCMTQELRDNIEHYVKSLRRIHQLMAERTMTVIHGDARMDNAMFGDGKPGLKPVVLVDWQAIMISNPLQDIAWMLATGIDTKVRRDQEEKLLAYYVAAVEKHGVKGYSLEQCIDDYNVGVLFLLSYPIIIAGAFDPANARGKELAEEGLRRHSATVEDRQLLRYIAR